VPLTETVEFLARLQKLNGIQVPVEVMWRYKLEPGELLKVKIQQIDSFDNEEFIVKLPRGGRFIIPWEVA